MHKINATTHIVQVSAVRMIPCLQQAKESNYNVTGLMIALATKVCKCCVPGVKV